MIQEQKNPGKIQYQLKKELLSQYTFKTLAQGLETGKQILESEKRRKKVITSTQTRRTIRRPYPPRACISKCGS